MLPKRNRLSRNELAHCMKQKTFRSEGQYVMLRIGPPTTEVFQAACIVSKKVAKRAVGRNRIRRRCYRAVKEIFSSMSPVAVIITAKKGIEQVSYTDLVQEIKNLVPIYEERPKK